MLGGIALRHGFDDFIRRYGHIGYGIRPSARGGGVASWALGRILDEARALGMSRVLLVCAADNVARSAGTGSKTPCLLTCSCLQSSSSVFLREDAVRVRPGERDDSRWFPSAKRSHPPSG
ncbi:GNAT family N-acetyltransferase [Amycolatopsis solani]|uniref:GNAT family N-acetyltransferase n=1 Tax=Amycolatopsis solani TaxID=3028615 RepID=UPI00339D9632